ncbi:MAG: PEP-CTERM sorting domain-containing protein [Fuerstiella sp.]|nr:PEP-CTERM sorting domain-containing protein [Fuerstiella sp.]
MSSSASGPVTVCRHCTRNPRSLLASSPNSNFADVGTVKLNVAAASVPEPSTFALLGLGVLILEGRSCQRRKTA